MISATPRLRRLIVLLAIGALVLGTGCGDGASEDRKLTAAEAAQLRDHLENVRTASARGDARTARSELRAFRREVRRLALANALSLDEQTRLTVGARQAEARARAEVKPPAPVAEQPAAEPSSPPGRDGDKRDGGHDREEGEEDEESDEHDGDD